MRDTFAFVLLALLLAACGAGDGDDSADGDADADADADGDGDADGDSDADADGDSDADSDADADADGDADSDADGDADTDADGDADAPRDECADGSAECPQHSDCVDTLEAYECTCQEGFVRNGLICLDVDECTEGTDDCDANADCANDVGTFTCTCRGGFDGDGRSCVDIDECLVEHGGCDPVADCANEPGAFTCSCPEGWLGDGFTCRERGDLQVLDLDGSGGSIKRGLAATGLSDDDVWNTVSGAFNTDYTIDGLLWADGTDSGASVRVINLPGIWGHDRRAGVDDDMFADYIYSWSGMSATLTFDGLPDGVYTVYGYSHEMNLQGNSGFSASVLDDPDARPLIETPTEYTSDQDGWDTPEWTEDAQYVVLDEVQLRAGQFLRVTVHAGGNGDANGGCILNGLQILQH